MNCVMREITRILWNPLSESEMINVTLTLVTALITAWQQEQNNNKEDANRQDNQPNELGYAQSR